MAKRRPLCQKPRHLQVRIHPVCHAPKEFENEALPKGNGSIALLAAHGRHGESCFARPAQLRKDPRRGGAQCARQSGQTRTTCHGVKQGLTESLLPYRFAKDCFLNVILDAGNHSLWWLTL